MTSAILNRAAFSFPLFAGTARDLAKCGPNAIWYRLAFPSAFG
jgi:hypothetical protein